MTKNKVKPLSYQEDKVHPFVHHEEENNNEDICFVKLFKGMEIFFKNSCNVTFDISGIFCAHICQSLEEAKKEQEAACCRREEEMQGIVMERRGGIGARALLWAGFGPLIGTLAVLVGFVLWPTENVFLHPNHWFECMLQCGVCWMGELHYLIMILIFM